MIEQHTQGNEFLKNIRPQDYFILGANAERCEMPLGFSLRVKRGQETPFVYFPETAVCAIESEGQKGEVVQLGIFGSNSFAGVSSGVGDLTSHLWSRTIIAGTALRVPMPVFNALKETSSSFTCALHVISLIHLHGVTRETVCVRGCAHEKRFADRIRAIYAAKGHAALGICGRTLGDQMGYAKSTTLRFVAHLRENGAIKIGEKGIVILDPGKLASMSCGCAWGGDPVQLALAFAPPSFEGSIWNIN